MELETQGISFEIVIWSDLHGDVQQPRLEAVRGLRPRVNIVSADSLLGVPYNIASYALLTHLLAHVAGLKVGEFVHTFGDLHIYANHIDLVRMQLAREPHPLPRLVLDPSIKDLDHVTREQIQLVDYTSHPAIYAEVAV